MTTPKKIAQKKPLPKMVRYIRTVLIGHVCPEWKAKIRKARTVAACRKLWEGASYSPRHTALANVGPDSSIRCLGCEMGVAAVEAMTFEAYMKHVTAKAKEIRAQRPAKAAAARAERSAA